MYLSSGLKTRQAIQAQNYVKKKWTFPFARAAVGPKLI